MARRYYPAQIEESGGAYGVWFPDFPGCVSGGKSLDEAVEAAHEALALHVQGMIEDGDELPPASDPVKHKGAVIVTLVGVQAPGRKRRFNVTLDENLVAAIDAFTDNRSAFLEKAARERLADA